MPPPGAARRAGRGRGDDAAAGGRHADFDRAVNYAGRAARPIPPVLDPEAVAEGIVACARRPKREVTYSRAGRLLQLAHATTPSLWDRFLPPAFEAGNYGEQDVEPGPGGVLEPVRDGYAVSGGWRSERKRELVRALAATLRGLGRGFRPRGRSRGSA